MAKVLLARGARGELVRKVQVGLTAQGFDTHGAVGKNGGNTETAVTRFQQQALGLAATGKVDVETWTKLLGAPVPTTQDRALQLTAAFEGHGFTLAHGNWDGAGITCGIVGFTLKHGELTKLDLTIVTQSPPLVRQAFGDNADELIDVLNLPKAVQLQF